VEYNGEIIRNYIGGQENLHLLVIFSFVELLILVLVHSCMEPLRRRLTTRVWHFVQNFTYLLSILSEAWIIAFVLANTDDANVFLFTNTLTAVVFAVTVFLSSGAKGLIRPIDETLLQQAPSQLRRSTLRDLTWKRGLGFVCSALFVVVLLCFALLNLNYTKGITIAISVTGGLFFGAFLLNKAFALIKATENPR
jgi:hypothetical protein